MAFSCARTGILIADTGDSRFVFDKTGSKSAEIITLPNNSVGRAQERLSLSRGVDPPLHPAMGLLNLHRIETKKNGDIFWETLNFLFHKAEFTWATYY